MQTCLLVKTKDNRKFLTHKSNLTTLKEFASTFKAEILLVKAHGCEILEINKLAPAFCDSTYNTNPDYYVLSQIFPEKTKSNLIKETNDIRDFIKKTLLNGKPISLNSLKNKYSEYGLTESSLSKHFLEVRKELKLNKKLLKKIGECEYCIV
jgi:hypothetical protein